MRCVLYGQIWQTFMSDSFEPFDAQDEAFMNRLRNVSASAMRPVDLLPAIRARLATENEFDDAAGENHAASPEPSAIDTPSGELSAQSTNADGISAADEAWLKRCREAARPVDVDLVSQMKRRPNSARLNSARLSSSRPQAESAQSRARIISMVVLAHLAALALIGMWLQHDGAHQQTSGSPPHRVDVRALNAHLSAQQAAALAPQPLQPVRQWLQQHVPARLGSGRHIALSAMTALVESHERSEILAALRSVDEELLALQPAEVLAWRAWALASDTSQSDAAFAALRYAQAMSGSVLNWRVALPLARAEALLGQTHS